MGSTSRWQHRKILNSHSLTDIPNLQLYMQEFPLGKKKSKTSLVIIIHQTNEEKPTSK